MNKRLYTDDNKEFTIKGLCFKNKECAINSIKIIENTINNIMKNQSINSYSPDYLHPKQFLYTDLDIKKYYTQQKMYRILALLNRSKVLFNIYNKKRDDNKDNKNNNNYKQKIKYLNESIKIFNMWMKQYKKRIKNTFK
jgi:hypothetical protein